MKSEEEIRVVYTELLADKQKLSNLLMQALNWPEKPVKHKKVQRYLAEITAKIAVLEYVLDVELPF